MATVDLTIDTLPDTIQSNDIVFLDFWADWCGPCKSFAPHYEAASEKYPDVVFGKIDTEAEQQLAASFGITSIPTIMIFREGVGLFSQPGALPPQALDELVEKVQALDMNEVHAEVAKAQAEQAAADGSTE